MDIVLIIVIIVAGALVGIALAGWFWMEQRNDSQLRDQFGEAEYNRVRTRTGSKRATGKELEARQKRVESYDIRPLPRSQCEHFTERWHAIQSSFVDAPAESVSEADSLVNEVMTARGYPMEDFEDRASDLSVDHGSVVQTYRKAHAVALSDKRGEASTEDLREAFIHYRELFDELLVSFDQKEKVRR